MQAHLWGGQLSPAEGVDRLEVDGGRLQRLRLLSVDVSRHHGNGRLGRYHRDGDALGGGFDERQRLGPPHRTGPDCQLLQRQRQRQVRDRLMLQPL